MANASAPDQLLLCFSHLRWDFVIQRPQHLMRRFARDRRVVFWEEAVVSDSTAEPLLMVRQCPRTGVSVATPSLPAGLTGAQQENTQRRLLDDFLRGHQGGLVCWYYTPMMLPFSVQLRPDCIVYDCMDELSGFKGAPPEMAAREADLIRRADLLFTGGYSLYEAKRDLHPAIYPFPSSVDTAHFATARLPGPEPESAVSLPRPRLGFYGVIDERMDLDLIAALADARPDWSIILVGPVVKIDPSDLPARPNLHYPGGCAYESLPDHLRSWDVALMPFAINAATRFISPTKTPEYLAAGKPVVSTPITDVVRHYGHLQAVRIADGAEDFVAGCEAALALSRRREWRGPVDALLSAMSWDRTQAQMAKRIDAVIAESQGPQPIVSPGRWPAEAARQYDVMVVGAGFAGAVMAERLAADGRKRVLVVDRRPHVGGNAYDRLDAAGILIHQYGPHIFHTNAQDVVSYLSRFTEWRPYEHRVLAEVNGRLVPIPINRTTLNLLFDIDLADDQAAAAFLASRAEPVEVIKTSEDVVIAAIGRELYETFFRGYTRKQWGMDPSELDRSVTARVPTRTNTDDRYFTDTFQAMPREGYTRLFERMLDHPRIELLLGVDYHEAREAYAHDHLVFTGPIDAYFDHRYGKLPYRSLRFEHETLACAWAQPVAVINYPSESAPHTRITEYKHLTGQQHPHTSITREYPSAEGDPYYPIPRPENQKLYKRYEALALMERNVTFVGRLATYRYYNMDQVVAQALATYRKRFAEPQAQTRPLTVASPAAGAVQSAPPTLVRRTASA